MPEGFISFMHFIILKKEGTGRIMFFKRRSKSGCVIKPPDGLGPENITTQSSICTGETLIGFLQPGTDKLLQAVVVRTPQDIAAFYASYGFAPPKS